MRQQGRGLRGEFLAKYMDMIENLFVADAAGY